MQGRIIKGIAGFYYVESEGTIYECKARGIFRNRSEKPLVGDLVDFEVLGNQVGKGNITKLLPRTSTLGRPEVANVDQALVVFASTEPAPDMHLLNRFLVSMEVAGIPAVICMNKEDLLHNDIFREIYEGCGYRFLVTSVRENVGIDAVRDTLKGHVTTLAGPSGVGKSSLINRLLGEDVMETGDISEKIKRGKNTTRHSELLSLGEDTFILDTPGFGACNIPEMEKEDLELYFPEIKKYFGKCRFTGCSHINEPDCAVKEALTAGEIHKSRYDDYVAFYQEIKNRKKW
jgi:ribosome biogenesis GTPase